MAWIERCRRAGAATACGTLLLAACASQSVDRDFAAAPPYVLATQERFWTCPSCHRLYWPATHHARMREELSALSLEAPPAGLETTRRPDGSA